MEKIASFCINHDTLTPGIYTSRVDFGDIVTYDLRFHYPNAGVYLSPAGAHTIEHIFATWVRSDKSGIRDKVVYFGPMGCLTGFYLILKDSTPDEAISAVSRGMAFVAGFDGDIPGAEKAECGNYLMHDIISARHEAGEFCKNIAGWSVSRLKYPE